MPNRTAAPEGPDALPLRGFQSGLEHRARGSDRGLEEISRQLDLCGPDAALDLEGVTVVSLGVIRFLLGRERQGTELLRCPACIREWISREGQLSR